MPNRRARDSFACASLALALFAHGCGTSEEGGTRIVVTVDSDIPADADPHLTRVVVDIEGARQPADARANLDGDPLPRELVLRHGGGSLGPFVITATGTLSNDAGTIVKTVGDVFFEENARVDVEIALEEGCIDVSCPGGQTCVDDTCEAIAGGGGLDGGTEGGTDGGTDAMTDAPTGDGGDGDAGLCATADGGVADCSGADEPCGTGYCVPATGACETEPDPDGTDCGTDSVCVAGDCTVVTPCEGANCNVSCVGPRLCYFDCTAADTCNASCRGDGCVVDCRGATTCTNVDCINSTKGCTLFCEAGADCDFDQCNAQALNCPDNIKICAQDPVCP